MRTLPPPETMYAALVSRDATFDGLFFAGVRTTRIFCRPVCPARKPRRENVEFFADAGAALGAGYRPCRRCAPLDMGRRPPPWVERLLALVPRDPAARLRDADLAEAGIEPRRARRWFLANRGMTFQAWLRGRRLGAALAAARKGGGVLRIGLDHGWESASGFSSAFARAFGRPPGRGRSAPCLFARWLATPLGRMLAVAGPDGLAVLEFTDRRALRSELDALRAAFRSAIVPGDAPALATAERELDAWFAGRLTRFTVPRAPRGTPFERAVWARIERVPYGETVSYARVAAELGRPSATRAVGRATGANPLAIVVPCHRVVGADGALCGYGGGLWRKRRLLEHERDAARRYGQGEAASTKPVVSIVAAPPPL